METRYKVGQKFILRRGKKIQERAIVDIYKTFNNAGELVKTRYVTQHTFLGQPVTDYDVCETTIAIALAESKL